MQGGGGRWREAEGGEVEGGEATCRSLRYVAFIVSMWCPTPSMKSCAMRPEKRVR